MNGIRRHAGLAPLLGLVLAVALTACGGADEDDPEVASAGGETNTSEPDDEESEDGGSGLEFAECMRDNGVENFPDPESENLFAMPPPEELGLDQQTYDDAIQACQDLMPGGGEPPEITAENLDNIREFAQCMRDNGIDMPDPDPDGSMTMPEDTGPNSEEFLAAMDECRDLLDGAPMIMRQEAGSEESSV